MSSFLQGFYSAFNWVYSYIGPQSTQINEVKSIVDVLIQVELSKKKMLRQSQRSKKESQSLMKKAKQNLRKNNDQAAVINLQQAALKRHQGKNLQIMSYKMQKLKMNIKSIQQNQQLMRSFDGMLNIMKLDEIDFNEIALSMQKLNNYEQKMFINTKMMQQTMGQNQIIVDKNVQQMLNIIKQELKMEAFDQCNENNFDVIKYPILNQNQ